MGYQRTKEGIAYRVANMFPPGVLAQHVGSGDDITNGVRHGGDRFHINSTAVEVKTFTWQFKDTIWMAGGQATSGGQSPSDWMGLETRAPATAGTSNPGAGAFNKVAVGGGVNVFVPAPAIDGDWDLSLTEKWNANVDFTKVVPVPAGNAGWFDYDYETHVCALNVAQEGEYNLFDTELVLGQQVAKVALCQLQLTVPEIVAKPMLPQWQYKVSINHATTEELNVCWTMFIGRRDIS